MLTTAGLFEQELLRLIHEQIDGAKDRLVSSNFDTVGGFEKVRGEIIGYQHVLGIVDEAKANVEKRISG